MRVGILGYSDIARRKFLPALQKSNTARCVAIASRATPEHAEDALQVPVMSYREMVCDPEIDLVYISLPNHLHEEWSIAALEQGRHVLCEKPLGLDSASVTRMLAAAGNNRLLYENIMYLRHPQHGIVKKLVDSGRIGRLLSLRSEFAFPGPAPGDFRLDPARGGGAFNDMNRYPLSAAQYFLRGQRHEVLTGELEERDGLVWSLRAKSVTDAGEYFSFLTAFGLPYRSYYELQGERGNIRVERAYTTPAEWENRITVTVAGRDESLCSPACDHFLGTIEHVCGLIRTGDWLEAHERARKLAQMADLFLNSCRRG